MADQCDNCKFVRPRAYGTKTVLECRFNDPFLEGMEAKWPIVLATDWCGRYAPIATTQDTSEYPPDHPAPGDLGSVPA